MLSPVLLNAINDVGTYRSRLNNKQLTLRQGICNLCDSSAYSRCELLW